MPTNEFLPWASGGSPNVMSQVDYVASAARTGGVVSGTASSPLANKTWRQSGNMAAAWGRLLLAAGLDALDDGDVDALRDNLIKVTAGIAVTSVPGYWKAPSGIILQWDLVTLGTGNGDVVTLPIAFPHDIFVIVATDTGAGAHGLAWARNGASVSTFKGYGRDPVTAGAFITTAYGYIAIGC